jgi:hypothetical protein
MRRLLSLIAFIVIGGLAARADIIVTLDNPNQTGNPGQTLSFYGIISNSSTDTDPAGAIYLNMDNVSMALSSLSYTWLDDLANTPVDLIGSQSSSDIDLFDIVLTDPQSDLFGSYSGAYTLLGGADGGANTAQDFLAQAGFTITTVAPEPGTFALLACAILMAMRVKRLLYMK